MAAAPVAFFAFNRPRHTSESIAALATNPGAEATDLFIFIDGPRNSQDLAAISEVESAARGVVGFRSVTVTRAERNQGLLKAITNGVSTVLSRNDRLIVLEDDIVAAPDFLGYMNAALDRYADDPGVGSIHAYSPDLAGLPGYFFLPGADCWGWGTWADRWTLFQDDAAGLIARMLHDGLLQDYARSHGWQSVMQLAARARGRNQSWAILWHASLFLAGRVTLHPGRSLVRNIGNDGSGTHAGRTARHDGHLGEMPADPFPATVAPDPVSARRLSDFLDRNSLRNLPLPYFVARWLLRAMANRAARRAARGAEPRTAR